MTREEEKYTTLDTEQCKWWVNHLFNMAKEKACNSHNFDDAQEMQSAQDKIIKSLEQQSVLFKSGLLKDCEICRAEQEPILDKIRDEIEQLSDSECNGKTITIYSWNGMKKKVFEIIDKYRGEMEVE